jgi:hypothetical protein
MNMKVLDKLMTRSLCLVILILLAGCHKEEPEPLEPVSFALDGFWDLYSMLCEKPVDLNFDRIYSNDIIAEIGGIPDMPEGITKGAWWIEDYHMQFESRYIGVNNEYPGGHMGYIQLIKFFLPKPSVIAQKNDNGILDVLYGTANENIVVKYSERNGLLERFRHDPTSVLVHEVSLNRDGTISITYEQDFYTLKGQEFYTEEGWETLIITTTYKKRQDS